MSMSFRDALFNQLEPLTTLTANQAQLYDIIMTGRGTPLAVELLEQYALVFMGLPPQTGFDWSCPPARNANDTAALSAIPWAQLLALLEQLLPIILPLL